ncbi:hypothetical protein K435DRAFT_800567 [Dendrothele bispora CBS 962.96]|uniref:Uncharacterized protein n=1 Tax=Dendrothele bispora (strain CBS 962.96) TaxID=1314807 RepID=A0A4S8LS51_DENBC|nr:hypothetical protein K435DRAFT_800567 [Dendrothele bispora CBS 962.96]
MPVSGPTIREFEQNFEYTGFIALNLPLMFCTLLYGPEPYVNQHNWITDNLLLTLQDCVKRMQFIAIVALFVFATLGFIFSCIYTILSVKHMVIGLYYGTDSIEKLLYSSRTIVFGLYILAKCYKIWGARKRIIVFPVFISIINNAGRIWWIGHQVSKFLPKRKFHLTRHVLAVCLESGIMYPLALIPALVLSSQIQFDDFIFQFNFPSFESLVAVLIQVVGIAPTFIIVRVALGISIENVHDTIRMNEGSGQKDQVLSMWEANPNIDKCDQSEE